MNVLRHIYSLDIIADGNLEGWELVPEIFLGWRTKKNLVRVVLRNVGELFQRHAGG